MCVRALSSSPAALASSKATNLSTGLTHLSRAGQRTERCARASPLFLSCERSNLGTYTAHDRKATEHCAGRGARGPHVSPPEKPRRRSHARCWGRAVARTRRRLSGPLMAWLMAGPGRRTNRPTSSPTITNKISVPPRQRPSTAHGIHSSLKPACGAKSG